MDAMNEALKRKMGNMGGGISIEIHPLEGAETPQMEAAESSDEQDKENQLGMENKSDMAPSVAGSQEAPDKMEILKGISDSGAGGRSPSSLGERAAVGAKAKMMEMMKKGKK